MCPRHVGGRYPTPGCEERALQPSPVYPFTHTTWRNVCTTSTRSRCASITASMDLYAIGVSSMTSASLRHSTPAVALAWSSARSGAWLLYVTWRVRHCAALSFPIRAGSNARRALGTDSCARNDGVRYEQTFLPGRQSRAITPSFVAAFGPS